MDRQLNEILYILFGMGISPSRYINIYRSRENSIADSNRYFLSNKNNSGQLCFDMDLPAGRGIGKNIYKIILENIRKRTVDAIHIGGRGYPPGLEHIFLPPPVLFCRGSGNLDGFKIAVVGSRRCTRYGREAASYISRNLSGMGIKVISGLALGIDSQVHKVAVTEKGGSIAVMGCGPDIVYPPENRDLYDAILKNGSAITEFPPGTPPLRRNFPIRNRIISGISQGVIVVEAGRRSGAMITGRMALEQDREVFAVPGSIFSNFSKGCHQLIKSGAKLVESIDDILEEFQDLFQGYRETAGTGCGMKNKRAFLSTDLRQASLSADIRRVFEHIGYNTVSLEQLSMECNLPAREILNAIVALEMENLVREGPSNHYRRCE